MLNQTELSGKKPGTIDNQASLGIHHNHNCACYQVGDMSSRAVHNISRKFHNVRKRPYTFSKSAYQPSHITLQGPSSENFLEIPLLEL